MTQEQKQEIRNLITYPEYRVLEEYLADRVEAYRNAPLDRSGDVAAQALAKEDAHSFIQDLIADLNRLASLPDSKTNTYE